MVDKKKIKVVPFLADIVIRKNEREEHRCMGSLLLPTADLS